MRGSTLAFGNVLPVYCVLMEPMRDYVVRRAREVKDYKRVSKEADVPYDWLNKIAQDAIENPGVKNLERLYHYYKRQEMKPPRRRAA